MSPVFVSLIVPSPLSMKRTPVTHRSTAPAAVWRSSTVPFASSSPNFCEHARPSS